MDITRFKYYIDGTLIQNEPTGIEEFKEVIERDVDNRFVGSKYPLSLVFVGDGYELIKSKLRQFGRNKSLAFKIQEAQIGFEDGYEDVLNGTIILAEGVDNVYQKQWDTKIRDNSYSRYIFNNKEALIKFDLTTSINGGVISQCSSFDLTVARSFNVSSATYPYIGDGKITVKSYDFMSLMSYLINYFSDNNLTVQSSWYESLGYGICLVPKSSLRENFEVDLISFDNIFLTVARIYNLYLGIDGNKVLIETLDYFEEGAEILEIDNAILETSFNPSFIYNRIKIGNSGYDSLGNNLGSTSEFFTRRMNVSNLFRQNELIALSESNSSEYLDLTPKLTINPFEPGYSLLSRRNAQSKGVDEIENVFLSDVYPSNRDYNFSFIPSTDNHALVTYELSTNKQKIDYLTLPNTPIEYGYLNMDFSNENIISRYKLSSDYSFQSDSNDFIFRLSPTETAQTYSSKEGSSQNISASQLAANAKVDQFGDLGIPSEYIGQEVVLKMRVMIPLYNSLMNPTSGWDEYGEPKNTSYFTVGSGAVNPTTFEMTLKIQHYELGVDYSLEEVITDAYAGKIYELTKTITPTVALAGIGFTNSVDFIVTIDDGLGSVLSKSFYVDFIDCVIYKPQTVSIDAQKSADGYSVINSFNRPLTIADRKILSSNPYSAIKVNGKKGYHSRTQISLLTGDVEFEVLTQKDTFEDEYLT